MFSPLTNSSTAIDIEISTYLCTAAISPYLDLASDSRAIRRNYSRSVYIVPAHLSFLLSSHLYLHVLEIPRTTGELHRHISCKGESEFH